MSNEASASSGNVVVDGVEVNHQYSKSLGFERAFRDVLAEQLGTVPAYFSFLRARSELWVARQFASLTQYHQAFRSCNRAFHLDRSRRSAGWCGVCDKCCFIDLVLAPFMERSALEAIFDGSEPLANEALADQFRALLGTSALAKPYECVGDPVECRDALRLTAARADRKTTTLVTRLMGELPDDDTGRDVLHRHLTAQGPHFVSEDYATADQLV
jgi:UDP-N-acetyl-alpha-D-muramoyl-L-alanyl-L-glutamate epimerase